MIDSNSVTVEVLALQLIKRLGLHGRDIMEVTAVEGPTLQMAVADLIGVDILTGLSGDR